MRLQFGGGVICPTARHGNTTMKMAANTSRSLAHRPRLSVAIAFFIGENRYPQGFYTRVTIRAEVVGETGPLHSKHLAGGCTSGAKLRYVGVPCGTSKLVPFLPRGTNRN